MNTARPAAVLAVVLALATGAGAQPAVLDGPVEVLAPGALRVGGAEVRLAGIRVPHDRAECQRRGRTFDCHRLATTALMDLTAGARTRCVDLRPGPADAFVGRCEADGYDLAEGMVYTGWARAAEDGPYAEVEAVARARGHGLWNPAFAWTPRWRPAAAAP